MAKDHHTEDHQAPDPSGYDQARDFQNKAPNF
jgi:hypothetical protein